MIRADYSRLAADGQQALLRELLEEIDSICTQSGAFADNETYRELFRAARKHVGMAYLKKFSLTQSYSRTMRESFLAGPTSNFTLSLCLTVKG